jgi:hypothetical protein
MNRSQMIKLFLSLTVALSGCATHDLPPGVGVWNKEFPSTHQITIRTPDGKFKRKANHIYDHAKPAESYTSYGTWSIDHGQIHETTEGISSPLWTKEIGRLRQAQLFHVSNDRMEYLSSDNYRMTETKIGKPSIKLFERSHLREVESEFAPSARSKDAPTKS